MKLSDFDYHIDNDLIAQYPLPERDASRLLVLDRDKGTISHRFFRDIAVYLDPGDILVLNDTKVIPARITATKPSGRKVEILLVRELETNLWEILVKGVTKGILNLDSGITAEVSRSGGSLTARFRPEPGSGIRDDSIREHLFRSGAAPLPFYIKREADSSDTERYQTVYAEKEGAIAAPTAGLHFTDEIISSIKTKGVDVRTVTLHVGYGTFRPVTSDNIKEHVMDEEFYEIPEETAEAVNRAVAEGRRVIAVGTTVTRTLESSAADDGRVKAGSGTASIFIYPGYSFRIIGSLITNFHQPRSTPMMLTSAFSGLDLLKKAYSESLKEGYRFFSYGDSMIIL
jgi:S-adenosylmethionine:tRNA ribosyltransferase-isomerase